MYSSPNWFHKQAVHTILYSDHEKRFINMFKHTQVLIVAGRRGEEEGVTAAGPNTRKGKIQHFKKNSITEVDKDFKRPTRG